MIEKALVTGGAGFIGSHLVDELLKRDFEVTIIDDFSTGREYNLKDTSNINIIRNDISNIENVEPNFEIIFHQAAKLEIFDSVANPLNEIQENIINTVKILEYARKNDIEKIIFASSACVYGDTSVYPYHELNSECRAQWPYGVSKLAAERYCIQYYELYGLKTVSLRYGIVYGPREWFGRVLPIFVNRAIANKKLLIFGDGTQTRDFVHVKDVVRANIKAIELNSGDGKAINIGSGTETTIAELAKLILKETNNPVSVEYINPKVGELGRKPGEWKKMLLDINLAKKYLNWEPKIKLKEGISDYIRWFKKAKKKNEVTIPSGKAHLWSI